MAWLTYVLIFVVGWWLILFMVLPFGLQNGVKQDGADEGTNSVGAPHRPLLKKKLIITTVLAVLMTLAYHFIYVSGLVSFRP